MNIFESEWERYKEQVYRGAELTEKQEKEVKNAFLAGAQSHANMMSNAGLIGKVQGSEFAKQAIDRICRHLKEAAQSQIVQNFPKG